MRFGAVPVHDAVGAVLAHTLRAGDRVLKKGRLLSAADVEVLAAAGHREVVCAQLDPGELAEDAAAGRIAAALAGSGTRLERTHTGRTNLHAELDGLIVIDRDAIARANAIDEAITVATMPALSPARAGEMVATVKIIPFGAREAAVDAAAEAVRGRDLDPAVARLPRRPGADRFAETPAAAARPRDRGAAHPARALRRRARRPARRAARDHGGRRGDHAPGPRRPRPDPGARRLGDHGPPRRHPGGARDRGRRDRPARYAGRIRENLLMLGRLGARSVIGVPGCARSLKPSGFDWVLQRVCAGVPVAAGDVAAMGVGGLLDEIVVRPSPRNETEAADRAPGAGPRIAAVVLAAGRASRMGSNKLIAELDGEPIVRRTVRAVLASRARPVVVVTGHEADAVHAALTGLAVKLVHNPDYADGMSTSLRAGVAAAGAVDRGADLPRRHAPARAAPPRRGDRRVPIRRPGRDHRPDLRPQAREPGAVAAFVLRRNR